MTPPKVAAGSIVAMDQELSVDAPTRREKGKPASKSGRTRRPAPSDTGARVSVVPIGSSKPRATTLRLCAANGTPIPISGIRQLTVNLKGQRRYPWAFVLANVPTGILGMDFLQYHELLIDSRRLQLINLASNVKVTGLKA
ncbi:unnamed protein product [Echinostoma caproni]|uniref:Peptidase A2 domain-containing protein n=1 Tax=Echinostoma caproni TaxID=27848 RepID=A0A183BGQ4_9TREM|nr:unnamed protein product [Echinostoma caproni]